VSNAHYATTKQELARWLPKSPAPPAPGSKHRILVKQNGVWLWEGEPIKASEKED
jgi:choline-sulfatase